MAYYRKNPVHCMGFLYTAFAHMTDGELSKEDRMHIGEAVLSLLNAFEWDVNEDGEINHDDAAEMLYEDVWPYYFEMIYGKDGDNPTSENEGKVVDEIFDNTTFGIAYPKRYIQMINTKNKNTSITEVKSNDKLFKIEIGSKFYHQIYNIILCFIIFKFNNLKLDKFYKNVKNVPKVEGRGLEKKNLY